MLISIDKLNNLCITDKNCYYHCYVNRQINVSLLSTNIKLLWTSFDLLTDRLMPSVNDPTADHVHFAAAVVYMGHGIFYMTDVNNFLLVN